MYFKCPSLAFNCISSKTSTDYYPPFIYYYPQYNVHKNNYSMQYIASVL